MHTITRPTHFDEFPEDLDGDQASFPRIKNVKTHEIRQTRRRKSGRPAGRSRAEAILHLTDEHDDHEELEFSYNASRHERKWIIDSLQGFFQQHWFDDVLRLLKGGKEASVYLCEAHPSTGLDYLAAKIYRPRMFRNLRNDHLYREGRSQLDADGNVITDDGMLYAIHKKTAYGQELMHTSWIEHEFKTMQILHAAGADLPAPFVTGNNAILMTYIGDRDTPAPTLNTISLSAAEAKTLFERVLHNVEIMLAHERVHGDLSAYNILYWNGEITLIDFPQAIDPHQNRNAYRIFERDVVRVCEYFARQGVRHDGRELAARLWMARRLRIQPLVDPAALDDQSDDDRAYWERMKQEV